MPMATTNKNALVEEKIFLTDACFASGMKKNMNIKLIADEGNINNSDEHYEGSGTSLTYGVEIEICPSRKGNQKIEK